MGSHLCPARQPPLLAAKAPRKNLGNKLPLLAQHRRGAAAPQPAGRGEGRLLRDELSPADFLLGAPSRS